MSKVDIYCLYYLVFLDLPVLCQYDKEKVVCVIQAAWTS